MKKWVFVFLFLTAGMAGSAKADWYATNYETIYSSVSAAVRVTTSSVPTSFFDNGVRARFTYDGPGTGTRFLYNGSTPTASIGYLLSHSTPTFNQVVIDGYTNVSNLRFISVDESTGRVRITYEQRK